MEIQREMGSSGEGGTAPPGEGSLCDGTIGIPLPGESLIEKYERSHMEKMASMIAVQLLPHSQRGILVANTSLISGGR